MNRRKEEEKLNGIPQFKLAFRDDDGEGYSVHFAALFSGNKNTIPIILSHGWPGEHDEPTFSSLVQTASIL